MKKITITLTVLLTLFACNRWKVSKLNPDLLCRIKPGSADGGISLIFRDNADILDMTFNLRISDKAIYCADNESKRLLVLSKNGDIVRIIGPKSASIDKNYSEFDFSTIGEITDDKDGNIYVQNKLPKLTGNSEISPSYILIFSKDGKLQETLGQDGLTNSPFYYIDNMFTDENNRLFVVSRTFESWSLSVFKNKKREYFSIFDKNSFSNSSGYNAVIEKIIPFRKNNSAIISVSFYDGTRFKFRKIFRIEIENNSKLKEVTTLPDPKNELFTILEDKYLVFWEVEGKDIRFVIWS
ncbi:MAG TPA: hypothetical protein PLM72_09220, partial [Spirochaetota bacterium]|nr:hypothetical protein [Spirochaetota bacterium]